MVKKIFYNSSLPRAGSTIIQNILAQNPEIYPTPTSGIFEMFNNVRAVYSNAPEFKAQDETLMEKGYRGLLKSGIYGFFNEITDRPYVVDKCRGWSMEYKFIDFFDPNPKIICMVRDLRDIFASMEKNFRENADKQDPILDWSKQQGTTVPKRVDMWGANPPVGMAIERLSELYRMGINTNILFVKFEDLCLYPEVQMKRIYDYLELPYFEHDFDNIEQLTKEDDEVYGIYGDHKIRKKLSPVRSRAVELLGKDVSDWIYNNYKWFYDRFDYKK